MNRSRLTVVAGVVVSLASVTGTPAQAQYRFVHLGTIAPPMSYPTAINNRNQVVGGSTVPGDASLFHGFLWEDGRLTDLGTLPGGLFSEARDINERGQIVGFAFDEVFRPHAVIWEDRQIREIRGPAGAEGCVAGAINDRGDIAGSCGVGGQGVLVVWRGSGTIEMVPTPSGLSATPTDINDLGVVTVAAYDSATSTEYGFRLERGVLTRLPPAPGYSSSVALRINNAGDAVGYSYSQGNPGPVEATMWHGTEPIALGVPPGNPISSASGINARGLVVGGGFSRNPGQVGDLPLLWKDGTMHVLPIPPDRVGAQAVVINDRGVIAGVAIMPETQESYAVLWVPDGSG